MRRAFHTKTTGLLAALFIGLAIQFQPLAAGSQPGAASRPAEDVLRALEPRMGSGFQFGKEPREVRIANCLRNASNTADQMALECERRHPKNKKGHAPGLSECYDSVVDYLLIEQTACRRMR